MAQSDITEKNSRIMKMVIILIWLVVFLIIILGIAFPLVYIKSMKDVYLQEQGVSVKLSQAFIQDFLYQRKKMVSISSNQYFMKDFSIIERRNAEFRGISEDEAKDARQYFQKIIDEYPSFRFFAFLSPDSVQPVFLQPYRFQTDLTRDQFETGYAYREWAQKTIENYRTWNKTGYLEPYVSDAFISQPGNVPAISMSVGVLDDRQKMRGILYVNMSLESLSEYVKTLAYGKTGKIFLVDSAGYLLAHPDISPAVENRDADGNLVWTLRDFSDNPMVSRALEGNYTPGLFEYPDTGKCVLSTFQTMSETGWIIVLEQEAGEAFSIVKLYGYVIIFLVFCTVFITVTTFFYIARETAEATRQHHELVIISETDPLTGLLNRRSMLSRMAQIISFAEQTGQGFVLAMFDIDDFKKVNDTYGHVFGDVVLREIAARTVSILRVDDLLFRWGGEEFLLILKNCDLVRGRGVAEKIRRVVCDTPISDGAISEIVTVTIGICRYKKNSIDSMIISADEALYSGKRSGKNKVVINDDRAFSETVQDREKMERRAADDEKVPDRMRPSDFLQPVYRGSGRVDDSPREKKQPAGVRDGSSKGISRKDDDPSHQDIGKHRKYPELVAEYRVKRNTDGRETPNQSQNKPSDGIPKRGQAISGIGSGDQDIDRGMIQALEDRVRFRCQKRMVERAHQVEKNHREAENAERNDVIRFLVGRGVEACPEDQDDKRGDGQEGSESMGYRVGDFLVETVWFW